MDAVKEAQAQVLPVFEQWAGQAPDALTSLRSFEEWAKAGPPLFGAVYALGIDPGKVVKTITGTIGKTGKPTVRSSTRRSRTRTTSSTTRTPARTRGNGHGPSTDQVLIAMREMGGKTSQAALATKFGVARQTIAKRLDTLVTAGTVTIDGAGAGKTWRTKEPTPA